MINFPLSGLIMRKLEVDVIGMDGLATHTLLNSASLSVSVCPPPPKIKEHRKKLDQLENKGVVKPVDPYISSVCGRKFFSNEKLINHFKQIHEREHMKRVSQIELARGSQGVKLVGKTEKYSNAARDDFTPEAGYGLGDEINSFYQN
ncbi:zinc finger, C2H2-like, PIN domain-like protein [Artemisia annua]|uniref:Zinc finger, C2H2-like, PIN domain-like protein n=1 Tax=Artemisia annua TaxID=35608 RepID=A0A2U1PG26_ARTAN|nr:zinc finger, C2H2-like, PIN domain-like protein [Artemisia annua]